MSDNYIIVIPEQPDFIPNETNQLRAISYFRSILPPNTDIQTSIDETIQFVDCGGNFESIKCPSCGAAVEMEVWQELMGMDYSDKGFSLNSHVMDCCHNKHTLNELTYYFPQGFAQFQLIAMNPNIGELSQDQISQFKQFFGCAVRIIYRRI